MLPPNVSPAAAAVVASLYFLPGMSKPPEPHCRIALYPGLHFVNQLKEIAFKANDLTEAARICRLMGKGSPRLNGPLEKLGEPIYKSIDVNYHWIFKTARVWDLNFKKQERIFSPRGNNHYHFGKNDLYDSSIDLFLTDRLDSIVDNKKPYDLLIYCPSFHSTTLSQSDADIDNTLKKVLTFPADRKLIVVRSPYDHWAYSLEKKMKIEGIGLSSQVSADKTEVTNRKNLTFKIVDQIINLEEAFVLFDEIRKISKKPETNKISLNELRRILKRLLVGLDPKYFDDVYQFEDLPGLIERFVDSVNMTKESLAWKVIDKIKTSIISGNLVTKVDEIREICGSEKVEVWVTKELDRRIIEETVETNQLDTKVKLADRWLTPGADESNRSVLLSRIDREVDLNLVAYLKPGDLIVMTAWEAVLKGYAENGGRSSILKSWERSEKWRQHANNIGITPFEVGVTYADPVLDLANYLESILSTLNNKTLNDKSVVMEEEKSWWDEANNESAYETALDRAQAVEKTGDNTYLCKEVLFDGGLGMFVREDDEFQIISEEEDGAEISLIPVKNLRVGMIVLLFKDTERNSLFDLLMDQLERSPQYQTDVRVVKDWKAKLKAHVRLNNLKISEIKGMLRLRNKAFDHFTIRSWVFGSTMAPQHKENLVLLVKALGLNTVKPDVVFRSVKNLRSIAITLGRALNQVILRKDSDKIDASVKEALLDAGIDFEELSDVVEPKSVISVTPQSLEIEGRKIRKLFKV